MKTGWMIVSGCLKSEKFNDLYETLSAAASKRNIQLHIKKNSDFCVCATEDSVLGMHERPDFVLFWDKDIDLAAALETLNIPVFNGSQAIEICDDKFKTHRALAKYGIRMPKTIKVPFVYSGIEMTDFSFMDMVEAELEYPMILKCSSGSFGEQVYLAHNRKEITETINKYHGESMIIQEYIKSDCGRDLRMYMVGEKCVAAIIRTNENDFRANIHLGGYGTTYEPDAMQVELAARIMKIIGLDFAGIDFLFDERNELVLCEVNSNAHFRELYDVTGINAAVNIVEYIDVYTKKDI